MSKHQFKQEAAKMKVTMLTCLAGPNGNARPGTVLDIPQPEAEEFIKERFARPYDAERDKKSPRGLFVAPETFER